MPSITEKFTGVGVALITPFKADLSVDFDALKKVIDSVLPHVDYLVVNGTTSEASCLSQQEKADILAFVAKNNTRKLPIMYGIGANDTNHVLNLIKETDFTHIDSILTVSPYYNRPSQEGIIAHYEKIADNCPVPILLYNVPGRTGANMEAKTVLELAQHPNIFGIKEASGDLEQCMFILKDMPKDFIMISGDDMLTTSLIGLGAKGVISVLANAFPETYCQLVHDALEGNIREANEALLNFVELNPLLYAEANPVGIKEVLKIQGLIDNYVRLPLLSASQSLSQSIKNLL